MPSIVPEGVTRGWIIPIGGAENKENDRHILERFVRVSGGRDADIVVIPTANSMADSTASEWALNPWKGKGVASLVLFHTRSRDEADNAEFCRPLADATGACARRGRRRTRAPRRAPGSWSHAGRFTVVGSRPA